VVVSKKALSNSFLAEKRPLLKKKLYNKLINSNTIKYIYVNSNSLRKALVGIDEKSSKIKVNNKLCKRVSKSTKARSLNSLV
jgi:hypothetical protein